MNFLAPGVSYSKFLKAYGISECKGFFPYEFFDSNEKLSYDHLPEYDAFYSTLKGHNVLDVDGQGKENYQWLQQVWTSHNMQTFRDFLVWYNNLDVGPFVNAVEKLQEFYYTKDIDPFKVGISLPAISRILLYQSAKAYFPLFGHDTQDIYKIIKRNIYGGPSIIFKRHLKSGTTPLRNNTSKICQNVIGEDANALYLYCLSKEFPTGCFVDRKAPDFKPEPSVKFMPMYFWMDFVARKENIIIKLTWSIMSSIF